MDDKSFVDLLMEENLSKINIDPRLVDSFKRVIKKLQVYFNSNGYTSERNYQAFFNEYLLNQDSSKNLSFFLNDEPSKIGAGGFYTQNGKRICIDENNARTNEGLDSTLCHEFIHFLVMRGIINDQYADSQIRYGGFINEALTEMLTRQMYPKSSAYDPQVSMMKFANLLSDNVNNYSLFLKGKIDARGYGASSWNNFVANATAYQKKWKGKPFLLKDAIQDDLYIQAQRDLIQSKISTHLISSFDDYIENIDILMQRPASDHEFIENFFESMDTSLIHNLGLTNPKLESILRGKLQEYRDITSSDAKYDNKDIYEFEIAGRKIGIDKDRKLYGAGFGYSASWNPNTGIYEFKVGNESIKLDINSIDFEKRNKTSRERQQNIAKYFTPTSKDDVKFVEQVGKTAGLIKLEKFALPNVGGKKTPSFVYIATYDDRIEILNNPTQLGTMKNVNLSQYIGITSLDPKVGAIYAKPLGTIENGLVYSQYSQKFLQSKTIYSLAQKITPTLNQEQIVQLINQYKSSEEFDEEDNLTPKQLQEFAIMQYAKNQYDKISEEQRKDLFDETSKAYERFIISTKNGKLDISVLFGNQVITAFQGQPETLVDTKGNGLYNEQFEIISKSTILESISNSSVLKTNENGNIIVQQQKESEIKVTEEKAKTPQENLIEVNTQLENLKQQYGQVSSQIEMLMQENQQHQLINYEKRLNSLIQQRDEIASKMTPIVESQRVYQETINREKEEKHQATLFQIEQITGTQITDTSGYAIDPTKFNGTPYPELKDTLTLQKEHGTLVKKLDELWLDGQIDPKTKAQMLLALQNEYAEMIKKAPKPIPPKPVDEFEQKEELTPTAPSKPQLNNQNEPLSAHKTEDELYKEKYEYDSRLFKEQEEFDRMLEQREKKTPESESIDKKKEDLLRLQEELRRQQYQEQLDRQIEEQEEIEHHGMSM